MGNRRLAESTDDDADADTRSSDTDHHPSSTQLSREAHTSPFPAYASPSISHGVLIARRSRHGGAGHGTFRECDQCVTQPGPPPWLSTRRLQVFSYVLAELSSATKLLPDYTKAILNLSRRLVGAWQAVTAASVERARYEHALVWAIHQWKSTKTSDVKASSPTTEISAGYRTFTTAPRRSSRRREGQKKRRCRSVPATRGAATSSPSPSVAVTLLDSATVSHKRRRLASEATPTAARSDMDASDQGVGQFQPHSNTSSDGSGADSPCADSPTACSKHLRADVTVKPPLPCNSDRRCGAFRNRAAHKRHRRFLHSTLQQLWLDAQEAEDKAGHHVEYIRGLVVSALYQHYLQVTVEASYHDVVLYRWLSPLLFPARRGDAGARQAWSGNGHRQRGRSASTHQGRQYLQHTLPYQAAVQVVADLQLLRRVLNRSRIAAGPSHGARRRSSTRGDSGIAVSALAMESCNVSSMPLPPTTAAARGAAGAGGPPSFVTFAGGGAADAGREETNGDGAPAQQTFSSDGCRSFSGLSTHDTSNDCTLAAPMPLHSFLQACLSFDPTHCAFALMSRCVVLAQHVRSGDDEQVVSSHVAPDGRGSRQEVHGGVDTDNRGVAERVDGEGPAQEYFGLFYVVIARRAIGACACTAMCFGNHKFIFVCCHDTEALLRETMPRGESDECACERSGASTTATVEEEERHVAHVSHLSSEGAAPTPIPNEAAGEAERLPGAVGQTPSATSTYSTTTMAATNKCHRRRPHLSHFRAHSLQMEKLTLGSSAGRINVLSAHDAHRLRRNATENSSGGERGLVDEVGQSRKTPWEAATHSLPSSPRSTPSSGSVQSTPSGQAHSPMQPHFLPAPGGMKGKVSTASSGATLGVAALPSTAEERLWGHSLTLQMPSLQTQRTFTHALSATQDAFSTNGISPAVPGRACNTATTTPSLPFVAQPRVADARRGAALMSDASFQLPVSEDGCTSICSPLPPALRGTTNASPGDTAADHRGDNDVEYSCAFLLNPPSTDSNRCAGGGGISTRCTASATYPMPDSALLPRRTSTLLTSSSLVSTSSDSDDDMQYADPSGRARRLQQRHGLTAEYPVRIADDYGEHSTEEEEEDAAAEDADEVLGNSTTQVFVVMHSGLCSCAEQDITREPDEATGSAATVSTQLATAKPHDFFELSPLHQHQLDTSQKWPAVPLRGSIQRLPDLSSMPCAAEVDLSISYFEQRVLLPPGCGHERQVGGGRSGDGDGKLAHPRGSLINMDQMSRYPMLPSARAAEPTDALLSSCCSCAGGTGSESTAAEKKASATVRDADVLQAETVVSSPPDPQDDKLYDFSKQNTDPEPKGTSSFHLRHALCASGRPVAEPAEGDMAFAAELYARLQFWSLRGQDRSAYIDPSWVRQSSHERPEEVRWSAPSALQRLASITESQEGLAEVDRQQPAAPLSSHATGVDAPKRVQTEMGRAAPDTQARGKPTPSGTWRSPLNSSINASESNGSQNAIRLPLRLLHCTVGTIELADEAMPAAPSSGATMRKRRRAANAEERQTKRRWSVAGNTDATEEAEEPLAEEAEECDEGLESLPRLPPLMGVNARGKELLFEALREATEVVVCGVRESRAHRGYHDMLHQRCPPPPFSTLACAPPQKRTGVRSEGDANHVDCNPHAGEAVEATTGAPSKSTWITTVNPWMAAATAAAAAQGCSFRVAAGTLSHDERNPFAFDTHRHLGVCGIVCWSQGDISHEEGAGGSLADATDDDGVMTMAVPTEASTSHGAEGTSGGATQYPAHARRLDSSCTPKWRWPKLPAYDHKQWRCELLKSEFRLARSRCLDCLLVDHTHGRPIAAITLVPRRWRHTSFGLPLNTVYSDDDNGADEVAPSTRCTERQRAGTAATDAPSAQEVVQRTVYVVVGFTHYIAPLWRHLREEKAVLVDMDRTLIDNAITVRSTAERQRHLRHLRRAVAAADGVAGAENPCVLWRRHHAVPSSERFGGALLRLGRNDAMPLTEEELAESMVRGADEQQEDALCPDKRGQHLHSRSTFCFSRGCTEIGEDDGVLRPTIRQRPLHSREPLLTQVQATPDDTSAPSSGGLLHCFMRRTASQRRSLGTVHYEECGAIKYTAAFPSASGPSSALDSPSKSGHSHNQFENHDTRGMSSASSTDADALRLSTAKCATTDAKASATATATPPACHLSDIVYVRPGVRQFLYRMATQWNIPIVLVTKSTRSRTEAILRQVLDPHRILFPDMRSSVVTANEMLRWCDDEEMCHDDVGRDEEAPRMSDVNFGGPVEGRRMSHSSSAASSIPNTTHTRRVLLHTPEPKSMAERIARCRKNALQVVQRFLDVSAMTAARRAWRAPAWCDWTNRLPKPRSIAVLDDAPQVWEEWDWPCTVNVAPYTLARVDPRAYFSRRGYATSLVLSCLFGSKCLVCSEGVLRQPEWKETDTSTSSSSLHTSSTALKRSDSRRLGAYRWPHCVCVCPADHLRDLTRSGEDVPVGYTRTSYSAAASDLSATVSAMLTALLWRMSHNASLCSSQQPLLLPAVEDSVVIELTEQARGVEVRVAASRRGAVRRHRRRRQASDLGATMAPGSEDRCEDVFLATATRADVLGLVGKAMEPAHLDTVNAVGITCPASHSLPVFARATRHSFAFASASAHSTSSSSSSSSYSANSSLSPTTSSSSLLEPFVWGADFDHAAVNAPIDTGRCPPSTLVRGVSMPSTPMAFSVFPDMSLESRVLGGVAEADDDKQHGWCISPHHFSANNTASGRNTARGESAALQTPTQDDYTATTTNSYEAPHWSSSTVEDVIPLETQAAPSVQEHFCTPGSPSHHIENVGGTYAMMSADSLSFSGGSQKALRSSCSLTSSPRKGVMPITVVPEAPTERVVVDVSEPEPPEMGETELRRPRHWLLDDQLDDVEDATPL
ncbi:hypothetical protein, conserved [Leishmania tarentolae]|uniref:Uncharacterized protein n=1 Tax=Leishmania tarentolae TaxID=5689 RepID=A0A640KI75_LEITA|nr:hypothetical protein, conserved [Leishmania tarentolae]